MSAVVGSSLVVESSPLFSTHLMVSSRLLTDFFLVSMPSSLSAISKSPSVSSTTSNIKKRLVLYADDQRVKTKPKNQEPFLLASSPSLLSAISKSSSVSSKTSNIKKRLVLNLDDQHTKTKPKNQEPKLAAYDVDWFDSLATKNECLKHVHIKNLPDTQEGQLTFLLGKSETSEIRTAFADAIGKVGKAAKKVFYPLPLRKDKLIRSFLELIYNGKSIMVDSLKDSFR